MRADTLRAGCRCTSAVMVRDGAVVCATCGAGVHQAGATAGVLSTAAGGALPAGWSRRRFLEAVRTMPAARRSGGRRGRGVAWEIDRADFEAEIAARRSLARDARGDAKSAPAPVVSIDGWLSSAGFRPTTRTA